MRLALALVSVLTIGACGGITAPESRFLDDECFTGVPVANEDGTLAGWAGVCHADTMWVDTIPVR